MRDPPAGLDRLDLDQMIGELVDLLDRALDGAVVEVAEPYRRLTQNVSNEGLIH